MNTNEMRLCPFCREAIHVDAIKCKHCGTMLTTATPTPTPGPETPQPGFIPLVDGSVVREYQIVKKLGEGGMGSVFLAEHTQTGQQVAMKVVAAELMLDQNVKRRFLEEARVMAALNHPNIVPLLTFFEEGGRLFLIMKFISGLSVEDLLARGPLPLDQVLSISRDVLAALDFAHSRPQPVIHRDIKPANILLDEDGRAMVTDFGIAKALGREKMTRTAGVVGTYEYMSPEQVKGNDVGPVSDQYSYGISLYRMLTGIVPFPQRSDTGIDCMNGHLQGPVPPLLEFREGLPVGLDGVLQRALAKSPSERFSSGAELVQALEDIVGTSEVRLPPSSPSHQPSATPRPVTPDMSRQKIHVQDSMVSSGRPPWFWGALVAGAIALGVVALLLLPGQESEKKEVLAEQAASDQDQAGTEPKKPMPTTKQVSPASPPACVPQCNGRQCGGDGCGGFCGTCIDGSQWGCRDGRCVCVPDCTGKRCGVDGCNGVCGTCPVDHTCSNGQCICVPSCSGLSCGDDGCGSTCGICGPGLKCEAGRCVAAIDLVVRRKAASKLLEDWVGAWNSHDADAFGAHFHRNYSDTNTWGNRTTSETRRDRIESCRALWKRVRWLRLNAKNVQIHVSETGDEATVHYFQEYRSDRYSSDGNTTLELVWERGRWWIIHEAFVGVKKY